MPVIHTHVSVSTTAEQREALKSAYGKAITAVPGKSEGWLMCPFEDNMPIYFGGDDSSRIRRSERVRSFRARFRLGEADRADHGCIGEGTGHPGRPHVHPLHRHHRLGLERRQLLTKLPPFLRGSPILQTSHLTYGKHTVFPASRFGATTSDEVTTVPARSWRCDVR